MCPASGLWGVLVPLWWLAVVYLARNSELGTGFKNRESFLRSLTRMVNRSEDDAAQPAPGLCAFSAYGLSPIDFAYGLRVSSAALGGYI